MAVIWIGELKQCPDCKGTGTTGELLPVEDMPGTFYFELCRTCHGQGKVIA